MKGELMNKAWAYLDDQLSPEDRRSFEAQLDASESARAALARAKEARNVWMIGRAPLEDVSSTEWARLDRAVFERVVEGGGRSRRPELSFGRVLIWAGAAAVLAIGLSVALREPQEAPAPAPEVAEVPVEPAERGAIYASGRDVRKISIAGALVTIQPQAACEIARVEDDLTRVEVVAGQAHFQVDERRSGQRFEVVAGDVIVTVVGTAFTVGLGEDGAVAVAVDHGVVRVSRGADALGTLRAGDSLDVPAAELAEDAPEPAEIAVEAPEPAAPGPAHSGTATPEVAEASAPAERRRDRSDRPRRLRKASKPTAAPSPPPPPSPAVVESPPAAPPAEARVATRVEVVQAPSSADAPRRALTQILAQLEGGDYVKVLGELKAWRKAYPQHRAQLTARYAIGYCLFKLGDKAAAVDIFESVAKRRNPWVNTAGDYLDPPRPR